MRLLKICGLFVAILLIATVSVTLSSNYMTTGGTSQVAPGSAYSFTFTVSNLDSQGYFIPSGVFGVLAVKAPSECGGAGPHGISECICEGGPNGELVGFDNSFVEAHGWPLAYAYDYYTCGSVTTYSPIAFFLDILFFAIPASLIVYAVTKIMKRKRPHSA